MAGRGHRESSLRNAFGEKDNGSGDRSRNLWTNLLESVASEKRLPEKNIIVLGGTPESQQDFLDALSDPNVKWQNHRRKVPPITNKFALGYTYCDVLDTDQDDTLARVSVYFLSEPSIDFASLVSPLLTPETVPQTALVVLLDWSQPHLWLRQFWNWLQVLKEIMRQVHPDASSVMEELMTSWKERGRGGSSVNFDGTTSTYTASTDGEGLLPLGPGEWAEPLGLPLCVVCQNAQKMELLERNKGWKEPDFDLVLQYLRTVLLRHGASLIYTSQNSSSQLPQLIHSILSITSSFKRQPLKQNVIDRDKILVASNWDSWGKICILGGNIDTELISHGWEEDIQFPPGSQIASIDEVKEDADEKQHPKSAQPQSAIVQYESWCHDPNSGGLAVVESAMSDGSAINVDSEDPQTFLERQLKSLEALKAKAIDSNRESDLSAVRRFDLAEGKSVNDHIGSVQFNMGGIQVDADDMLQRLKERNSHAVSPETEEGRDDGDGAGSMAKEYDNEQLQNFFSGLMNRTARAADSTCS